MSAQVDYELYSRVCAYAKEHGMALSQVIRMALYAELDPRARKASARKRVAGREWTSVAGKRRMRL